MTATSPPTVPVQPPEPLPPKSRKGIKFAAAVVGALVLLGGGFAAGYAVGHSPVAGYQQQIAMAHRNLTAEQAKLATEKATLVTEQSQVTTTRQTAQKYKLREAAAQRKLRREQGTKAFTTPANTSTPVVAFGCKILQNSSSGAEQFEVFPTDNIAYDGTVYVSFYDYAGSGHTFPGTSLQGVPSTESFNPVPAADIGGSAEPSGCIASAG
jgi:hypothetical protein